MTKQNIERKYIFIRDPLSTTFRGLAEAPLLSVNKPWLGLVTDSHLSLVETSITLIVGSTRIRLVLLATVVYSLSILKREITFFWPKEKKN